MEFFLPQKIFAIRDTCVNAFIKMKDTRVWPHFHMKNKVCKRLLVKVDSCLFDVFSGESLFETNYINNQRRD